MLTKTIWTLITITFLLSGCKVVPPANAEEGFLQPPQPEAVTAHELHFDVRAGLRGVVSLSPESGIMVRVNQGKQIRVRRMNLKLLREWGDQYLKIHDYDRDGMNDIAVLRNAGRGGKNLCYAVYRYNAQKGHFRKRKSFDHCH